MKHIALFAVLLALPLAACSWWQIDKPVLSDDEADTQLFPITEDSNRMHPLYPTDRIKTKAQALAVGVHCGQEADDRGHWRVHRDGDIWVVHWANGQNTIEAHVAKSDGTVLSCSVNDASAPRR
ncbi:MAG: hypothetical protein JO261_01475 [Alphaproteobacteria bacterium]|nr:hypothetical protein [Alphaproteobacteria bacterium]MBV9692347.1 hypothetical protein [Alphaproteobacteria bacterium]